MNEIISYNNVNEVTARIYKYRVFLQVTWPRLKEKNLTSNTVIKVKY